MPNDIQAELTSMATLYAAIRPTLSEIAEHKQTVREFAKAFLEARTAEVLPVLKDLQGQLPWQRFERFIEQRWGYLEGTLRSMRGMRSVEWAEMTDGLEVSFEAYLGCGEYETVTTMVPPRFLQGNWQARLTQETHRLTRMVACLQQRAARREAAAQEARERATLVQLQAKYPDQED